jgi:Domain of unknown function (DUF4129)
MSGEGEGTVVVDVRRRRTGMIVAIVAAAVVLVAFVSAGDGVRLATEGSGGWYLDAPQGPPRQADELAPTDRRNGEPIDVPGAGAIGVLAQAVVILVASALLFVSGRAVLRTWRRTKPDPAPEPPIEDPVLHPHEIVDAIDEGLEAMVAGPIDDVVIDCWVRLEKAAASAGVERLPSETSSELAARVLSDLHAPAPAVELLLSRYRTARYSHHPLGEDDRAVAIRSLAEIRAAIVGTPA